MSVDPIAATQSAEAQVAAAYARLADALANDQPAGSASPDQVERDHATVGSARVALAEAEAAVNAARAVPTPVPPAELNPIDNQGHGPAHLVEVVV